MKNQLSLLFAFIVLIEITFSCKREESNYPIELTLVEIEQDSMKAYTQHDRVAPPGFDYYNDADSLFFYNTLFRRIIFISEYDALLLLGDKYTGYLKINARVSYVNDSIIFKLHDTIDDFHFSDELHGVGDENGVILLGTAFIRHGSNDFIIYKYYNLENLRKDLPHGIIAYSHFKLKYE